MKTITLLVLTILFAAYAAAEPVADPTMKLPAKGFIQDSEGVRHWYETTVAREDYFIGDDITGETYRMKFAADDYLPNDDGSKMVLANIITRFFKGSFVHADGEFDTNFSAWKKAEGLQKKGYYIPCKNYPQRSMWIDLVLTEDGKQIKEIIVANGLPVRR